MGSNKNVYRSAFSKMCQRYGVASDLIDYDAHWDSSLSARENFDHLRQIVKDLASKEEVLAEEAQYRESSEGNWAKKYPSPFGKQKEDFDIAGEEELPAVEEAASESGEYVGFEPEEAEEAETPPGYLAKVGKTAGKALGIAGEALRRSEAPVRSGLSAMGKGARVLTEKAVAGGRRTGKAVGRARGVLAVEAERSRQRKKHFESRMSALERKFGQVGEPGILAGAAGSSALGGALVGSKERGSLLTQEPAVARKSALASALFGSGNAKTSGSALASALNETVRRSSKTVKRKKLKRKKKRG